MRAANRWQVYSDVVGQQVVRSHGEGGIRHFRQQLATFSLFSEHESGHVLFGFLLCDEERHYLVVPVLWHGKISLQQLS